MPIARTFDDIVEKLDARITKAATEAGLPGKPFFDCPAYSWVLSLNTPEQIGDYPYIFRYVRVELDDDGCFVKVKADAYGYGMPGHPRVVHFVDGKRCINKKGALNLSTSWLVRVMREAKEAAETLDVYEYEKLKQRAVEDLKRNGFVEDEFGHFVRP